MGKINSYTNSFEGRALEGFKTMFRFILAQTLVRSKPFNVPNLGKYSSKITGILQSSPNLYLLYYD